MADIDARLAEGWQPTPTTQVSDPLQNCESLQSALLALCVH